MPSPSWNYFVRSEDGDSAKCGICGLWISCKGTTTSLKYHLTQKHRIVFSNDETNSQSARSTPVRRSLDENTMGSDSMEPELAEFDATDEDSPSKVSEANVRPSSSSSVDEVESINGPFIRKKQCRIQNTPRFDLPNPVKRNRAETITAGIAKMIAMDMLPLSFSENRGFVEFMNTVLPGVNIPGRKSVQNCIGILYNKEKEKVTSTLRAATSVALTTDAWSSRSTKSYITVTAHLLDADWKIISLTLETTEFEERHTAINLRAHLDDTVKRWNLRNRVIGIVHDNAYNIQAAVRDSDCVGMSVPCFAHTLQCAVNAGLAGTAIKNLVEKCRGIVGHFKHSNLATTALADQQRLLNLPKHRLMQSCRTRWNSIYAMFERLLEQQLALQALEDGRLSVARTSEKYQLNNAEWEHIDQLTKILKPFDRATTVMSSENGVTLSMVRPLVHSLMKNFLKPNSTDGELAAEFKDVVRAELTTRFLSVTAKGGRAGKVHIAQLAMILDPRYKRMVNEDEEDKISTREKLNDMIDEYRVENGMDVLESGNAQPTALDYLFMGDDSSEAIAIRDRSQTDELFKYLGEEDIGHNSEPLKWWRDNETRYPIISAIAKKYLAVPATSTPAERVFSTAGNIVNAKRSCLSSEHVDVLIFLYQNRDFI